MGFLKRRVPEVLPTAVPLEPETHPLDVGTQPLEPDPHPLRSENYEPVFPRTSTARRVLGHITDEVDRSEHGPRNTLPAITAGVISDPHTDLHYPQQVPAWLDALVDTGLASEHEGVYRVTEAGWRELMN